MGTGAGCCSGALASSSFFSSFSDCGSGGWLSPLPSILGAMSLLASAAWSVAGMGPWVGEVVGVEEEEEEDEDPRKPEKAAGGPWAEEAAAAIRPSMRALTRRNSSSACRALAC